MAADQLTTAGGTTPVEGSPGASPAAPAAATGVGRPAQDKSIGELVRDLADQSRTLARQEVALARNELALKGKVYGAGAVMFAAAGLLGFFAFAALVAAGIAGFAVIIPVWGGALAVAGALLAFAGVVALLGRVAIAKGSPPLPEQTIESTKEDVAWLKTRVRSAKP